MSEVFQWIAIGSAIILTLYNLSRKIMTEEELKAAVAAAVGEEAAEVAAKIKELEDRIANLETGSTISEGLKTELVAMVQNIYHKPV